MFLCFFSSGTLTDTPEKAKEDQQCNIDPLSIPFGKYTRHVVAVLCLNLDGLSTCHFTHLSLTSSWEKGREMSTPQQTTMSTQAPAGPRGILGTALPRILPAPYFLNQNTV